MRIYILVLFAFTVCFILTAYNTPEPPRIDNRSVSEYLKLLHNKIDNLKVVTGNPNGSVKGNYGDMLLYSATGPIYYFTVNVSSPNGTTWKGIQLGGI